MAEPGQCGVARLEHRPVHESVLSPLPGQGTYSGWGFNLTQSGSGQEEKQPIDVSLFPSPFVAL